MVSWKGMAKAKSLRDPMVMKKLGSTVVISVWNILLQLLSLRRSLLRLHLTVRFIHIFELSALDSPNAFVFRIAAIRRIICVRSAHTQRALHGPESRLPQSERQPFFIFESFDRIESETFSQS